MSCGYGPKALLRFTGASWFLLLCFPASHLCTLLLCTMTAVTDILPNSLSVLDFVYSVSCPGNVVNNVVSPSPPILMCGYWFYFVCLFCFWFLFFGRSPGSPQKPFPMHFILPSFPAVLVHSSPVGSYLLLSLTCLVYTVEEGSGCVCSSMRLSQLSASWVV